MSSNENNNEQSPPKRPPRKNNLKILEKYKIIKELGRGAFGAALLVTRHTDNKNFVMKKIDLQNMPPQEKKAAEIEVNVLKKLKHQNIVKTERPHANCTHKHQHIMNMQGPLSYFDVFGYNFRESLNIQYILMFVGVICMRSLCI